MKLCNCYKIIFTLCSFCIVAIGCDNSSSKNYTPYSNEKEMGVIEKTSFFESPPKSEYKATLGDSIPEQVKAYLQSDGELEIKTDGRIIIRRSAEDLIRKQKENEGTTFDYFRLRCLFLSDKEIPIRHTFNLAAMLRVTIGAVCMFPNKERCKESYFILFNTYENFERVYELLKKEYIQFSYLDFDPDQYGLELFPPTAYTINRGLPTSGEIMFENTATTGLSSQFASNFLELQNIFRKYREINTGQNKIEIR